MFRGFWFALGLALLSFTLLHADLEVPRDGFEFDPDLTGRGEKMNHGPFLTYSLISGNLTVKKEKTTKGKLKETKIISSLLRDEKKPPIFLRSVNIYLGGKYAAGFDTEMCAFAAAWKGGFLNISQTNLNGYKGNDLAYLREPVVFQNGVTPGWSLTGDFSDPRKTPFGSLPKTVAHYKGLYLHGWKTILRYTVGSSTVLELPEMLSREKVEAFSRSVHIDTLPAPRWMFVCDLPGGRGEVSRDGQEASLTNKSATLRVRVVGAPKGSTFEIKDRTSLVLRLPASTRATSFRVLVANGVTQRELRELGERAGAVENIPALCKGGPARWKKEIVVKGRQGKNDAAYTIDEIPLPDDNPWGSWMRPGAFDFFSDGRAALCTWNGDVWIVSGLNGNLEKITWKRYATGLFEALGVKIVKDQLYVLGRDQITRLYDLNNDGEADYYENFNNDGPTAPSFHSFAIELHTDRAGNFYYTRGGHRVQEGTPMHGGIIRVSKDGSKAELICHGFREVNGMSIGPDDTITAADNQGNWVPASKIDLVEEGAYYGYRWGLKEYPEPKKPLCWIPYAEDNSSGGQVWVTSDRWGPFKGHMLHTSYGTCKLFKVFLQRDGEKFQGGVVSFPFVFPSGIMRAQFNPADGQLYVAGLKGWGTKAKTDGCFYRVRYTGKPVTLPVDLHVSKDRITVKYAVALDPRTVNLDGVKVEQWNYRWTKDYGSKDYSVKNPKKVGRDRVNVKSVRLSADGRTVTLEIPGLVPVMQMGITLTGVRTREGLTADTTVYNTINYVPGL